MNALIIVNNRLVKISGNLVKAFSWLFHALFPNKRFVIPEHAPALRTNRHPQAIPRIFWQTNYSNHVSLPLYLNYLFNRLMSRDYEYRYASDEAIEAYFRQHASRNETEAYLKLNDGAAKADFWRLVALYYTGGVYLDFDASFVWPLGKQIQPDDKEIFLLNKQHYTNYFMASAPGNPVYRKAIDIVIDNINSNKTEKGVYMLTGPDVVNRAIGEQQVNSMFYRYVCVQGAFSNEHFHYIDKKQGKWTHTSSDSILKQKDQ